MKEFAGLVLAAGCLVMPCATSAEGVLGVPATRVNCDKGQTISGVLARIRKLGPNTVLVSGTCTETVWIEGFTQLALHGATGATLVAPDTFDDSGGTTGVLTVLGSNGVSIDGLSVNAGTHPGIAIRGGASDVRLRNLTVAGSLWVFERAQVLASDLSVQVPFGFGMFVGDSSDVHLENSVVEVSEPSSAWSVGAYVAAQLSMHNTTFRDFYEGIYVAPAGELDLAEFGNINPVGGPTEVRIENPAGTNHNGCRVEGKLVLFTTLRIADAGDTSGAGLLIENGGSVIAHDSLVVSGSHGQSVFLTNNSSLMLMLGASTITGGDHGGLVVANQSSVDVMSASTTISGNVTDVYCDSTSLVVGGDNIAGATTTSCPNLRAARFESPLP